MIGEILPGEMRAFAPAESKTERFFAVRCGACRSVEESTPAYNVYQEYLAKKWIMAQGWRNIPPYAWCCPGCVVFLNCLPGAT